MLKASLPPRFNIGFASGAGGGFIRAIPQASQIGITSGAASLTDGFPPLCFQPVAAGGIPPFGEDFNGVLSQMSLWCQWFEAGAPTNYDSTFATGGSGGYPQGAIIGSNIVAGNAWMSLVDNNTTDPDSVSSSNWVPAPGLISSGTPVPSFSSTVPTGFVVANALTIGSAASSATNRANADTLLLYRFVWLNFSNSICPILTSGGSPTTRGANPDVDFAANKQLTLPDQRGVGLVGVDTMGGATTTRLAGVPVNVGNATTPGSAVGENLHQLVQGELAKTTPAGSVSYNGTFDYNSSSANWGGGANQTVTGITTSAGGTLVAVNNNGGPTFTGTQFGNDQAHNTVSLSRLVFWNLKL